MGGGMFRSLQEMMAEEADSASHQNRAFDGDLPKRIADLKRFSATYLTYNSFKVGDVLRWKDGMRNRSFLYGEPLIVVELYDEPFYDADASPGSTLFREPLDIRVGVTIDDGEFITFVVDRRRLEHHDGVLKPHDEENIRKFKEQSGAKPALSDAEIEAILNSGVKV